MIITKMALPRRSFLRGLGATLALPMLDAMVPALSATARAAGSGVTRLGFCYAPNGTYLPNFHPATTGTGYKMTPVLQALEPFQKLSLFYYYIGADPLSNGLDLVHAGVMIGLTGILVAMALVTFERRDLVT